QVLLRVRISIPLFDLGHSSEDLIAAGSPVFDVGSVTALFQEPLYRRAIGKRLGGSRILWNN
ncbi:MAG: hypothetical protein EBX52_14700, partial [Proteobacteria bacterium]|nr:hypothetical protein [Pseudomonadota bacterium]